MVLRQTVICSSTIKLFIYVVFFLMFNFYTFFFSFYFFFQKLENEVRIRFLWIKSANTFLGFHSFFFFCNFTGSFHETMLRKPKRKRERNRPETEKESKRARQKDKDLYNLIICNKYWKEGKKNVNYIDVKFTPFAAFFPHFFHLLFCCCIHIIAYSWKRFFSSSSFSYSFYFRFFFSLFCFFLFALEWYHFDHNKLLIDGKNRFIAIIGSIQMK